VTKEAQTTEEASMHVKPLRVLAVIIGTALALGVAGVTAPTASAMRVVPPSGGFVGDGCTDSPDSYGKAKFSSSCNAHDECYSSTSHTARKVCDKRLHASLDAACRRGYGKYDPYRYSCYGVADVYYHAVRQFGKSHYSGHGNPG
jgi:hypothetical protein